MGYVWTVREETGREVISHTCDAWFSVDVIPCLILVLACTYTVCCWPCLHFLLHATLGMGHDALNLSTPKYGHLGHEKLSWRLSWPLKDSRP